MIGQLGNHFKPTHVRPGEMSVVSGVLGLSCEKVPRFKRELHQIPSRALADLGFYKSSCSKTGIWCNPQKALFTKSPGRKLVVWFLGRSWASEPCEDFLDRRREVPHEPQALSTATLGA